jgi:hypothetical protein
VKNFRLETREHLFALVRRGPNATAGQEAGATVLSRYLFFERPGTLSQAGDPLHTNGKNAPEAAERRVPVPLLFEYRWFGRLDVTFLLAGA